MPITTRETTHIAGVAIALDDLEQLLAILRGGGAIHIAGGFVVQHKDEVIAWFCEQVPEACVTVAGWVTHEDLAAWDDIPRILDGIGGPDAGLCWTLESWVRRGLAWNTPSARQRFAELVPYTLLLTSSYNPRLSLSGELVPSLEVAEREPHEFRPIGWPNNTTETIAALVAKAATARG